MKGKTLIMRERVNPLTNDSILMTLRKKTFENIVGKGEKAGNQHFLLFLKCFLPYKRKSLPYELELLSANPLNFHQSKILSFVNGLRDNIMPFFYMQLFQITAL